MLNLQLSPCIELPQLFHSLRQVDLVGIAIPLLYNDKKYKTFSKPMQTRQNHNQQRKPKNLKLCLY